MTEIETLKAECAALRELVDAQKEELEALRRSNVLWGKTWFATGDSFTEGDYRNAPNDDWKLEGNKRKTYPYFVGERNHMTIINDGLCGSILPLSKEHLADPEHVPETDRRPFTVGRYLKIPENVDYITLMFGANDAYHDNLGTIDDTENTTFYGAWNFTLRYLIEHFPFAKIGIIVTFHSTEEYRAATREIARKWCIPMLDLMNDPQVPMIFNREREQKPGAEAVKMRIDSFVVAPDNSHPNLRAHEYLSTVVEHFLRSL